MRARFGCKVVGAAADAHRLPQLDQAVVEGDKVTLGGARARVIDTPGHTRGQINFFFPDGEVLLSGDTLFSLGCGRLIEGTAAEMFSSPAQACRPARRDEGVLRPRIHRVQRRFAITVEPDNDALKDRIAEVKRQRAAGQPSVPSTMASELAANPFLRAQGRDHVRRHPRQERQVLRESRP